MARRGRRDAGAQRGRPTCAARRRRRAGPGVSRARCRSASPSPPSTDGTEAVAAELAAEHDDVIVVANPAGTTPAGLNAAIRATAGDVVVRVDGHAELSPGYIRRAVETLRRTGAANVGGVQRAAGTTPFEEAVADAMTSPFGTGDADVPLRRRRGPDRHRLPRRVRPGGDRARRAVRRAPRAQPGLRAEHPPAPGGRRGVVRPRAARVTYRPRGSLRDLARQYFEYGRWKRSVVRQHPQSLRWRQAVPPAVTAAVTLGAVVGLSWRKALVVPGAYGAAVAVAAAIAGKSAGSPRSAAGDLPDDAPVVGRRVPAWRTAASELSNDRPGRRSSGGTRR